jgi:hypothetical protein
VDVDLGVGADGGGRLEVIEGDVDGGGPELLDIGARFVLGLEILKRRKVFDVGDAGKAMSNCSMDSARGLGAASAAASSSSKDPRSFSSSSVRKESSPWTGSPMGMSKSEASRGMSSGSSTMSWGSALTHTPYCSRSSSVFAVEGAALFVVVSGRTAMATPLRAVV